MEIEIPLRFVGPPDSANGGYACGVTAQALTDGAAQVTLRRPPPVGRPLQLAPTERGMGLHDGEHLVAEVQEVDVPGLLAAAGEVPPVVGLDEARSLAASFDVAAYRATHPYPGCFGCGPDRSAGDGLCIFPASVDSGAGATGRTIAWPWVPDASLAAGGGDDGEEGDGLVAVPFLWAALDCPGGLAWMQEVPEEPLVLGRMTTVINRRPAAGEQLVSGAWAIAKDGRKRLSGSVVWDDGGEVLALSHSTWIVLSDDQRVSFRAAGPGS